MRFSAEWLALRAGADRRARDPGVAARLGGHFAGRAGLRVLDLGAGTGAMMQATAPLLGPDQAWRLVDADAALLDRAAPPPGMTVERVVADLGGDLAQLFRPPPDLVTASAFFDLCGAGWIDRLLARVAAAGAAVYAVLSYDGREGWQPPHPLDDAVLTAFHADQRRDKGLGPALGPGGATYLAEGLAAAGYRVSMAPSDWRLSPPEDARLIRTLASASAEAVAPTLGEGVSDWLRCRRSARAVTVGHVDLLALPPDRQRDPAGKSAEPGARAR